MIEDLKGTQALQEKISDTIFNLAIQNTLYRRNYYIHITTLAVAILGFSVLMLDREGTLKTYLIIGIIIFLVLIILLLSHLREVLDEDQRGLDKQNEEYKDLLELKKNICFKYLARPLSANLFEQYQKELRESPEVIKFEKAFQEFEEQRKLRYKRLNYFGEFIILLFLAGLFFILISIANISIRWYQLIITLLILAIISFINISQYVSNLINKIVYFISGLRKKPKGINKKGGE